MVTGQARLGSRYSLYTANDKVYQQAHSMAGFNSILAPDKCSFLEECPTFRLDNCGFDVFECLPEVHALCMSDASYISFYKTCMTGMTANTIILDFSSVARLLLAIQLYATCKQGC